MELKSSFVKAKLRDFRPNDIADMVTVLAQTWDFGNFADARGQTACQLRYLLKNAHLATEAIVAEKDGVFLGYLFGRIPTRALHPQHDFLEKSYVVAQKDWETYATPQERQQWETDWMWVQKWYAEQYRSLGVTAQEASHMDLFMVAKQARGLGVGTLLFSEFKRRHQASNAGKSVLLQTDTWCGWRFYEKNGFERLATCPVSESDCLDEKREQAYFVYGGKF